MNNLPSQEDNPEGFHQRYIVSKASGEPVDPDAVYLVLRIDGGGSDPDHQEFCREAAREYCRQVFSRETHAVVHPLGDMASELWQYLNEVEKRLNKIQG